VTLVLVFGGTIAVADAIVRRQQGSLVTGLAFGEVLRGLRADAFEALQVRLSPVAAHAVIDAVVADLHGVVGDPRRSVRRGGGAGISGGGLGLARNRRWPCHGQSR